MIYRGNRNYERRTPLNANRLWSAFSAVADDRTPVELRLLEADPASAQGQQWIRRFQLLSVIRHAGIRQVVEITADHDPPFVIIESLLGSTLAAHKDRDPLPLPDLLQLAVQLFAAIWEAHRCGVVAGMITPDMIYRQPSGAWVLDLTSVTEPSDAISETTESDVCVLCGLLKSLLSRLPAAESSPRQQTDIRQSFREILDQVTELESGGRASAQELAQRFALLASETTAEGVRQPASPMIAGTMLSSAHGMVERTFTSGDPGTGSLSAIPEMLGRFKLHERLGAGAVGTVFRATDISNQQTVAIKILNADLARNPEVLRRFGREARILLQSGSPYVASLLESGSDQNLHYLAIEYVAGGTLTGAIRNSEWLSESVALRLMLDVVRGLSSAHQQGIFHRDIKPDNILLTAAGAEFADTPEAADISMPRNVDTEVPLAKLSDFGLARMDRASESLAITHDGAIMGTPLYMSPEQCQGLPADARSDVYSLGATLFQLLSGRPPFQGDNSIVVMNAHCNDPLPSLSRLQSGLSDPCITVVEKCLSRNPDARYVDAGALQADLERLLHGEPTSMRLHPASPQSVGKDVLEFQFTCDLASAPGQLWAYVSNTDRINHSLGLPAVSYTTRNDPVRGVERFAETRILGQRMVWQEHPYEWIEGRRLSVLREFSVGPFLWFMNIIELTPVAGGGTRLTQTFRAVPRRWLGQVLAKLELGVRLPKAFRRAYERIDQYLLNSGSSADAQPWNQQVAITRAGRGRLQDRVQRLYEQRMEPRSVEALRQFLEHASDLDVARIRPMVFAERFQLNPKDVVEACLTGTKEGLLVLLWDILCPSCRIPADIQESLTALKDHAYCPACDMRYEVDFANSVELIFRAHPEIRAAETRTYCVGGPAFSAHVVAQIRLAAGERFELELQLNEGSYRVRGPQLAFAVDLRVSAGVGVRRLDLALLRPPLPNTLPVLQRGSQVLSLLNNTASELQIRIERTAGRSQALTAAAAATIPMFRDMFPQEVLSPGQIVSVANITLLMAEICGAGDLYRQLGDGPAFGKFRSCLQRMDEIVRSSGGAIIKTVSEGIVATFSNPQSAVAAAAELMKPAGDNLLLRISIHRGPAMVATLNDRLDYFGEAVHITRSLLDLAADGELLTTASTIFHDDMVRVLDECRMEKSIADFTLPHSPGVLCRCRLVRAP